MVAFADAIPNPTPLALPATLKANEFVEFLTLNVIDEPLLGFISITLPELL